ncbi:uncharacterized protein LOC132198761 [Neocloeon triangulifer]|uniref:uncharacterized protein LOC132198761 n=1 Tax=Neocloeon triangulifer TaxID=2078957 RepID=UPI00286F3605|nr:uncharacterized protein LOC132198761 [Neocloeon triangulifer]
MKCCIIFAAAVAVANAGVLLPTLVRTPAHDSAYIKSERFGGNFAYKTIESHAYALHTPIVQHYSVPISFSYPSSPFTYAAPAIYTNVVAPEAENSPKTAQVEVVEEAPKTEEEAEPAAPEEEPTEVPMPEEEESAAPTDTPASKEMM